MKILRMTIEEVNKPNNRKKGWYRVENSPTDAWEYQFEDTNSACDSPWHLAPQKFKNSPGTFVWECPFCGERTTYPAER